MKNCFRINLWINGPLYIFSNIRKYFFNFPLHFHLKFTQKTKFYHQKWIQYFYFPRPWDFLTRLYQHKRLNCIIYTYFGKWVLDFSLTASMYIFPDSTALRTSPANSMLLNAKQLSMSSRYTLEINGSLCSIVGFCFQVKNSLCNTGSTWKTNKFVE